MDFTLIFCFYWVVQNLVEPVEPASLIMITVIRKLKDISEEAQSKIKYDLDEDERLGLKGNKSDERNVTANDGLKLVSNLPPEVKMEPIFERTEVNIPIASSLQTISSSMAKVESSASISAQNQFHVPFGCHYQAPRK